MTLPVPSFASLAAGDQPASLLDSNFNALGAASVIACTATGSNAVALTPVPNYWTPANYTDSSPVFTWIQQTTSTASVTIAVGVLPALAAFTQNGSTAIGAGALVAGQTYTAAYNHVLNSGAGGFVVDVSAGAGAAIIISDTAPPSPVIGQLWWDSVNALLNVWYQDPNSSQWVNVNAIAGLVGAPASTFPGTLSITAFGGVGDGVTDNTAAFNAACAALPNGGTVYFPPGTWFTASSNGFAIPSGIHVQGAGENATTLIGNGHNYAITIVSLLTGTGTEPGTITYPINAPAQYGSTVTTTSAADAGNFNPNDVIFVSGGLHGTAYWFPGFITTVASVNAGTGVITLNESLPIGGADVTIVQKVLTYVTDVKISDLTINIPPGAVTGGMQAVIARNVSIERVASRTNATTRHSYLSLAGVRDAYIQNSTFVGGYLDCLGCDNATVVNCTVQQGVIVFDGGTINSSVINNDITDPQVDGSANTAISIVSGSQFNRIIGNVIKGQFASVAINVAGGGGALTGTYGWNTVIGNIIYGTNTTSPTGISVGPCVNNTVVGNNVNNVNTGIRVANNSTGQIVSGNIFTNVPIPVSIDSTSGTIPPINDTWNVIPAGTTSPNVAIGSLLQTGNSSGTSITGFTGGIQGQEVTLFVNDANTTLVNGGTFVLQQITNFSPPSGTIMKFSYRNGVWREISRSNNSGSANVNFRGLQIGPGGGGLTISSIATQAAARKGTLAIDTNNLAYYDPGLTTSAPQAFSGTSGAMGATSSATIAATGTFTLTLPASPLTGAWVYLVSTTAQIVQSASANVIPLAGGTAGTAIFPATAPHWCILQYNGTSWITFASA